MVTITCTGVKGVYVTYIMLLKLNFAVCTADYMVDLLLSRTN